MRPAPPVIPGLVDRLDELMHSLETDGSPRNVMRVAEAQWMGGRASHAVELLEPLLLDFPGSIAPRLLLAWCLEDCGRAEDGARVLEEARALDPSNPFLKREKRPAKPADAQAIAPMPAIAAMQELPVSEPEPPAFVADFELPAASEEAAHAAFDEPALELERFDAPPAPEKAPAPAEFAADTPLVRLAPRDPEREAEPESALTVEELREIPPSPLYSATLGEIFEKQGFDEKAIEIYREVARMHPERADLLARIEALESRAAQEPGR